MASAFSRPFSFWSHHNYHNPNGNAWKKVAVSAAAAAVVLGGGVAIMQSHREDENRHTVLRPMLPFACLAIAQPPSSSFTEPQTGVSFPDCVELGSEQRLAGTGLRKKSILGLKNITVYAYGVYSNEYGLKEQLGRKYGHQSVKDIKDSKAFYDDLITSDVDLTVRLVIVYGRLKIGSVRSAFEDSIGSRIKKFSGTVDRKLLESFTSLFSDDIKLPKGTTIDITRQSGQILKTRVDGKELGVVQSPLLCRAFLDLYIGDEPFDVKGRENIGFKVASLIGK